MAATLFRETLGLVGFSVPRQLTDLLNNRGVSSCNKGNLGVALHNSMSVYVYFSVISQQKASGVVRAAVFGSKLKNPLVTSVNRGT